MSKFQEEKNEQKSSLKTVPSMSSRQQVLYFMSKTKNDSCWEAQEDNQEAEILDYHNYYLQKKEWKVSIKV